MTMPQPLEPGEVPGHCVSLRTSLGCHLAWSAWPRPGIPPGQRSARASAVPDALDVLAAIVWAHRSPAAYLAQGRKRVLADLRDPVLAPFVPVSAITGMLLAAALSPFAFGAGRILVGCFSA